MAYITSKDGTRIAYTKSGSGPAVILVDGALCSRAFGPMPKLAPLLAKNFTVISYDRRGRNESSDTQPYAPEREIEDIGALITEAGGSASLFGISSGAALALLAAASGLNITRLAVYEPPYRVDDEGHKAPADSLQQLKVLVEADKRGDAVKFFIRDMIGVPGIFVFLMTLMPMWPRLKAVAHTLPYDVTILDGFVLPEEKLSSIKIPTLIAGGGKSPISLQHTVKKLAEIIPNSRLEILKGQTHNVSEKAIAPLLTDFLTEKIQ